MRQPPAKVKNRQIAFVFCFGLPSVWERSTKLRIHRSHSCNFFYRSYSRILAPYCNSSHITKAIAIEWGVKSSLYKCYMITYPSVLRSPSVFRVSAAIPSEYMALSQTFSVTSHSCWGMFFQFTDLKVWSKRQNTRMEVSCSKLGSMIGKVFLQQ